MSSGTCIKCVGMKNFLLCMPVSPNYSINYFFHAWGNKMLNCYIGFPVYYLNMFT